MEPKNREKDIDELLIDYALGEIDPEDKGRVELMLAEKPELMREARALKRMAAHFGVSMIVPSPRLTSRVRHAAYEARAGRGGWRRLVWTAFRRPIAAAAAGLVAVALVVALVRPWLWGPSDQGSGTHQIGTAATMLPELKTFLQEDLRQLQALESGQALDPEDFSVAAGSAMMLAEKAGVTDAQRAVLQDIKAVWEHGHNRVNSFGRLSDDIIVEMRDLAAQKRLVERIEALLTNAAQ